MDTIYRAVLEVKSKKLAASIKKELVGQMGFSRNSEEDTDVAVDYVKDGDREIKLAVKRTAYIDTQRKVHVYFLEVGSTGKERTFHIFSAREDEPAASEEVASRLKSLFGLYR